MDTEQRRVIFAVGFFGRFIVSPDLSRPKMAKLVTSRIRFLF